MKQSHNTLDLNFLLLFIYFYKSTLYIKGLFSFKTDSIFIDFNKKISD